MRFSLEHHFDAPVDVVEKVSNDPDYVRRLSDLPNLGERRVKTFDEHPDGSIDRVVHYKLGSQLPAPVVAVIGSAATWDEVARFDPASREWTFEIRPNVMKGRIDCRGRYRFVPDGDGTRRTVEVDLKAKVPLVGGRVEKEIGKGLTETLEAEAELLTEFLAERDPI
ncbi:MAG: DUF2505 domain-containing protein [Actinomycetota bacterium]